MVRFFNIQDLHGGYTLASVSSSLQNLDNKKAEGYVVGAEFEAYINPNISQV